MNKWLICLALVGLAIGSIGLAVHDDGGGGGGVYTARTQDELRQLLQDYRARRDALRRAITAPEQSAFLENATVLSEEQEMLHLQQLSYEAQRALLQANRFVRAR